MSGGDAFISTLARSDPAKRLAPIGKEVFPPPDDGSFKDVPLHHTTLGRQVRSPSAKDYGPASQAWGIKESDGTDDKGKWATLRFGMGGGSRVDQDVSTRADYTGGRSRAPAREEVMQQYVLEGEEKAKGEWRYTGDWYTGADIRIEQPTDTITGLGNRSWKSIKATRPGHMGSHEWQPGHTTNWQGLRSQHHAEQLVDMTDNEWSAATAPRWFRLWFGAMMTLGVGTVFMWQEGHLDDTRIASRKARDNRYNIIRQPGDIAGQWVDARYGCRYSLMRDNFGTLPGMVGVRTASAYQAFTPEGLSPEAAVSGPQMQLIGGSGTVNIP